MEPSCLLLLMLMPLPALRVHWTAERCCPLLRLLLPQLSVGNVQALLQHHLLLLLCPLCPLHRQSRLWPPASS